uniref:Tc1-like transposase DDE domain-containing protein n=1 Tax=Cyprinus carpio carpio TaxID=630221 RepID=A0A9J8DET1_CYPCA
MSPALHVLPPVPPENLTAASARIAARSQSWKLPRWKTRPRGRPDPDSLPVPEEDAHSFGRPGRDVPLCSPRSQRGFAGFGPPDANPAGTTAEPGPANQYSMTSTGEDLAPAHTAKSTKSWLNDHGVGVFDWPANSPDLNPRENLWSIVKRKMRNQRPNNAGVLKATVKETWASIPPQQCHKLITSMPRQIEAVIKAKGAPTKY